MDPITTEADVQALLDQHPFLTVGGWWHYDHPTSLCGAYDLKGEARRAHWEEQRAALLTERERQGIDAARAFIRDRRPSGNGGRRRRFLHECSSYQWKHTLQYETGTYVTNGAFIAAALIEGVKVKTPTKPGRPWIFNPNPLLVLSTVSKSQLLAWLSKLAALFDEAGPLYDELQKARHVPQSADRAMGAVLHKLVDARLVLTPIARELGAADDELPEARRQFLRDLGPWA